MTQRQSFGVLIAHMIVALAVLTAATVLCALHDLGPEAVIALFGAAIGLLGGNAQSLSAAVINGGPKPDLTKLAESSPHDLAAVMGAQAGRQQPAPAPVEHAA